MEIKVNFLDNLRLQASFDDFKITTDQPVRYKGDGSAPSPFDYFLASSALCAAYFVKVYCKARDLPTEDIVIKQNNVIDPEDRYAQLFKIDAQIPESFSEKHRQGIIKAMDRCTVKKVIQTGPGFAIEAKNSLGKDDSSLIDILRDEEKQTHIQGKDKPLEETIRHMSSVIQKIGIKLEIASWRNIVKNVWSVHVRDADAPMCYTNGKGATKESALASALGEYLERLSCNYFYNDYFLGNEFKNEPFVHYPDEKWFKLSEKNLIPEGLLDDYCLRVYDPESELTGKDLLDTNSGLSERGICALPFKRLSDNSTVYFPVSILGNLYVSNGMSAGNSINEAQVQCLSEIFERAIKKRVIEEQLVLPSVPSNILERYPKIQEGLKDLESKGFPLIVRDASLGGRFPVMCIALMNPKTGGVFASFGAHPKFEIALERCLTELMQGRSFEGLNDVLKPTFNSQAITEPNNFVEHFIDSNGLVSWRFFSDKPDFVFSDWNIEGTTEQENMALQNILRKLEKEVYIANYEDLGVPCCRIIVPGFSEIYPVEDLIWENTNRALEFREDILCLHSLKDDGLTKLLSKLDDSELDHFMMISDLIGIDFDENTVWGQLNIGELKLLINLALKNFSLASELTKDFLNFNDNRVERKLFYQALDACLDINLSGVETSLVQTKENIKDYRVQFKKMFGEEVFDAAVGSIEGTVRFFGLCHTSLGLEGLERHNKLVESYRKIHVARKQRFFSSDH